MYCKEWQIPFLHWNRQKDRNLSLISHIIFQKGIESILGTTEYISLSQSAEKKAGKEDLTHLELP